MKLKKIKNATKKGLLGLVITALTFLPLGCKKKEPKEPKLEDFQRNRIAVVYILGNKCIVEDIDGDGKVDGIVDPRKASRKVLYFVPGYENRLHGHYFKRFAKEMTPEIREVASVMLRDSQRLNYEAAKENYERIKSELTEIEK